MAMTTTESVEVVSLQNDILVSDQVIVAPCGGMGEIEGNVAYTAPPAGPPKLEFSADNVNYDSTQNATVDASAAPGITLYKFDKIQIDDWKFARITIPATPGGAVVRGGVRILPIEEA